jgi:thioredoxin reductase (NADPH)
LTLVTDGDALTAQPVYADPVRADPKIEIRYRTAIEEIIGDIGVSAVRVRDAAGDWAEVAAHGVFVFVGLEGNSALVADRLAVDAAGRVPVDDRMRTPLPGLFAAGTIRQDTKGRAAAAAKDGETAAAGAVTYLTDGAWL